MLFFYHNIKNNPNLTVIHIIRYKIGGYVLIMRIFNVGFLYLVTAYSTNSTTPCQSTNFPRKGGGGLQEIIFLQGARDQAVLLSEMNNCELNEF